MARAKDNDLHILAACGLRLELESLKQEWIIKQQDLASKAIFEDHGLAFAVSATSSPSTDQARPCSDFVEPIRRSMQCPDTIEGLHVVGGLDISFSQELADEAVASLTILSYPSLQLLHSISKRVRITTPYIPSFLSMRESGPLVDLINDIRSDPSLPFPQLFLVDGNGRLHEREAGLAVHVGLLANVPTIGCAKEYCPVIYASGSTKAEWRNTQKGFKQKTKEVLAGRGDWLGLHHKTRKQYIGAVSRTDSAINGAPAQPARQAILTSPAANATAPLIVSPGHRISLESAMAIVLACCKTARVPEPIRQADAISRQKAKEIGRAPAL